MIIMMKIIKFFMFSILLFIMQRYKKYIKYNNKNG